MISKTAGQSVKALLDEPWFADILPESTIYLRSEYYIII